MISHIQTSLESDTVWRCQRTASGILVACCSPRTY